MTPLCFDALSKNAPKPPLRNWCSGMSILYTAPKADEAFENALEVWLGKQRRLADFLARNPNLYIPQMEVLTAEDWLDATKVQEFDTEAAYRKALGALRGKARSKFSPQIAEAIKEAIAAIGQAPTDPLVVAPYLPPGFNIDILKQLEVNPSGEVPLLKSIGRAYRRSQKFG